MSFGEGYKLMLLWKFFKKSIFLRNVGFLINCARSTPCVIWGLFWRNLGFLVHCATSTKLRHLCHLVVAIDRGFDPTRDLSFIVESSLVRWCPRAFFGLLLRHTEAEAAAAFEAVGGGCYCTARVVMAVEFSSRFLVRLELWLSSKLDASNRVSILWFEKHKGWLIMVQVG